MLRPHLTRTSHPNPRARPVCPPSSWHDARMSETTITVTGRAETELPPERATASISVQFDGAEPLPAIRSGHRARRQDDGELRELHDPTNGPVTPWSSDQLRTWSARPWNADGVELPLVHHVAIGDPGGVLRLRRPDLWLGWRRRAVGGVGRRDRLDAPRRDADAGARRTARPRRARTRSPRRETTPPRSDCSEVVPQSISETGIDDGPVLRMMRGLAQIRRRRRSSSSRRRRSRSRPPSRCASRRADRYSPRWRRLDIARAASRLSCCSRSVWRLSYSRLPFATASSTLARPSLK